MLIDEVHTHLAAAAVPAEQFAASARAVSPAELVALAEHVVAAAAGAAAQPAGLPAPQYGSPQLPLTAAVCFPIAKKKKRRCAPLRNAILQ